MPLTRKLSTKSLIKQNTSQDSSNSANQTITKNTFTASGVGPYSLTVSPISVNNTQVYINGVYQEKNNYTLAGNQITFSVAPPAGTSIEVISGSSYNIGTPNDGSVTTAKISSGAAAAGTLLTANGSGGVSFTNTLPTITRILNNVSTNGTTITVAGTYNPPANVKYIKVRMVGAGGGGAGGGQTGGSSGTNGGNTTFGTSLLTANGGATGVGTATPVGGVGGTVTISSPAITIVGIQGGDGSSGVKATINVTPYTAGLPGAYSPFGGAGAGNYNAAGSNAVSNSGSGGGSGAANTTVNGVGGGSGGAGGYIEAIIVSPSLTYSYSIGSGGTGGAAGTSGYAGGAGGSGVIIVEEYYQ
jgi:hypothetical protein